MRQLELDNLITKVKSLLSDIDDMHNPVPIDVDPSDSWFGPFSEAEPGDDGSYSIEWPNLSIAAEDVQKALDEYESGAGLNMLNEPNLRTLEEIHDEAATNVVEGRHG